MWIPHRVFFANLAFVVAVVAGVLLLAYGSSGWRRWVVAMGAPALTLGTWIGLTATRGMPLLLRERVAIGAWVGFLISMWLIGAAVLMHLVRRRGGSRAEQAVIGGLAALLLAALTRAALRG